MFRQHVLARLAALALAAAAAAPLAPADVAAQAAPGDSISLSLADAVARATGESQEVRIARAQVALARAQVTSARSAAFPQLDGGLTYNRTFATQFDAGSSPALPDSLRFEPDTTATLEERIRYIERNAANAALGGLGSLFGNLPFGRPNTWTASLVGTQPIYSPALGAALKIASRYREAAEFALTEEVATIELQVRDAYYRALLAHELERIAAAAVVQADTFLVQERLRQSAGTASELDVLRAEVAAENLRPQLVAARNAASLATLDLKRLIDIPLDRPVRLTTPLTPPSAQELATPEVDASLLLSRRAAVRAAEQQVAIREQQVRIARAGYLPSLNLSVNYARIAFPPGVFDFRGEDWRTDFSAAVALRVPIFNGFRTSADVQGARVTLLSEQLRLTQLRENVELQYQQALGERQRAAADIAARQRTVEQAQRVYDLTVLRYEQGLATQLEVNDARLNALQARTNLAQAVSAFYLAGAGVSRSLGTPMTVPPVTPTPTPATPRVTTPPATPPTTTTPPTPPPAPPAR